MRPFRGVAVAEPALASNAGKTSTRVIPIANKVDRSVWAGTGTAPRPGRSRTSLLCVMIILPTRVLESRRAAYLSERPQPFVLITSTQLAVKASESRLIVESSTCVASVSDGVDSTVRTVQSGACTCEWQIYLQSARLGFEPCEAYHVHVPPQTPIRVPIA